MGQHFAYSGGILIEINPNMYINPYSANVENMVSS